MVSFRKIKATKAVAEGDSEPRMRGNASLDLEASLHQPAEDNSIVADFTSLRGYIESHTLEFYHSDQVDVNVAELMIKLKEILPSTTIISPETLARSLIQPESRPAGIRAVIALILFASIDLCGAPERTILPPCAIAHMSTFSKPQDWPEEMQKAYQHAVSKWRVLSAFLLSAPDGRLRTVAPNTNSWRLAEILTNVFRPFAIRSLKDKRVENLKQIVARTAKIGNTLFGHPSTWRFRWNMTPDEHRRQGTVPKDKTTRTTTEPSIVVYPAIEKLSDVDGVELANPILKEEAEIYVPTTFPNVSFESEDRRQGSLKNEDVTSLKSTFPRPVAYDRTTPEKLPLPEWQPSKMVQAAAPTAGWPLFEGQPRLGPLATQSTITDPQSGVDKSNLDVDAHPPPQEQNIKTLRRITASLRRGFPAKGMKRDATEAAPIPAQNSSILGTGKSLPSLPDAPELQEIPIEPERGDDQPRIDTDLNGSQDLSQLANQDIET